MSVIRSRTFLTGSVWQVRNYLIYRTAKDASILITIQPKRQDLKTECEGDSGVFTVSDSLGYQEYYCHASVIDLDLKPYSKMKSYLLKEWEIFDKLDKTVWWRVRAEITATLTMAATALRHNKKCVLLSTNLIIYFSFIHLQSSSPFLLIEIFLVSHLR